MGYRDYTFETLPDRLAIELIQTPREELFTCGPREKAVDVLRRNEAGVETYDYVPVEDGGVIVGMFRTRQREVVPEDETIVEALMDDLSSTNLMGGDGAILDYVWEVDEKPVRLVVAGNDIAGLVTWSDLQKLPVRAMLFALVTELEMAMADAIRRRYPTGDRWLDLLPGHTKRKVKQLITTSVEKGSEVDAILYTQFSEKVGLLQEMGYTHAWDGTGGKELFRAISSLRNDITHGRNYAVSRERVADLQDLVRSMVEICEDLKGWPGPGDSAAGG